MDATSGRFEKRFILESLFSAKAPVLVSCGGTKRRAFIHEVGSSSFLIDAGEAARGFGPSPRYRIDVGFRGLAFRVSGTALSCEDSFLRIDFQDPWELLSDSPSPQRRTDLRPAMSLASGDLRVPLAWPRPPETMGALESASLQGEVQALGSALGSEYRFRPLVRGAQMNPVDRVLAASGKRIAVFGPPPALPERPSALLRSFAFLGLSEYESLLALEGGPEGRLPEPGIQAPLFRGPDAFGFLERRPADSPFTAVSPSELTGFLLLEDIVRSFPSLPERDSEPICLSLQADALAFAALPGSPLSRIGPDDEIRVLVSYPNRSLVLRASLRAALPLRGSRFAVADLSSGSPEDYRFLFESLYGLPFDGEFADYLIKKAAP